MLDWFTYYLGIILHSLNIFNIVALIVVSGIALLYIFWDVNYFIRIAVTIAYGKLFIPKKKPNEEMELYGFCTTQDVDIFIRHMNNARYVRELDFARFQFYERTGLYSAIVSNRGLALQGASSIRYRRPIPLFTSYKVVTKLIYWDEKALYLQQSFITLKNNFVNAVILSKQNIKGANVDDIMKKLLGDEYKKPTPPEELEYWLKSIEISSEKLRQKSEPEDEPKNESKEETEKKNE